MTASRQAIISDEAGTTRDRQYGRCQWCGKEFSLVDTGGWVRNSDDVFEEAICDQVTLALEEADVILFVVDAMTGQDAVNTAKAFNEKIDYDGGVLTK